MGSAKSIFFLGILGIWATALRGQDSLLQVVAEPGDGVYSLLRKHGADPSRTLNDFLALNETRLQGGTGLYEGLTYLIPIPREVSESVTPGAGVETPPLAAPGAAAPADETPTDETPAAYASYDIFGAEYAEVRPESSRLENTVFYLISGHGGPDPGAMTRYGDTEISEDEYAYDVTLRLARKLIAQGAQVYIIIRDPDDGIRDTRILEMDKDEVAYPDQPIPLNQVARLKQRVEAVNLLYREHVGKHQRLVVTHVDSRSQGQNIDVFFYYHEKSKTGKKLAENIHETFRKKYAQYQPNRVYSGTFEDRSNLYLVKNTLPATTFIEIGNIRNTRDQRRILDPDNRQALANWICEGLILDYETR